MAQVPEIVGQAVLRDYPLRLWAAQQEHTHALIREFTLLLAGRSTGQAGHAVPARLVQLAETFNTRFGPLLAAIQTAREEALRAGLDRIDSAVPLVKDTPAILGDVGQVLADVDDFCARGDLLTLARPPEQVALTEWSLSELVAQYNGGVATPWRGPF